MSNKLHTNTFLKSEETITNIPISEQWPSLNINKIETESSCLWREELIRKGTIILILMQVRETDGAKTRDAHKDTELKLIDGLDFFSLERKQMSCE